MICRAVRTAIDAILPRFCGVAAPTCPLVVSVLTHLRAGSPSQRTPVWLTSKAMRNGTASSACSTVTSVRQQVRALSEHQTVTGAWRSAALHVAGAGEQPVDSKVANVPRQGHCAHQ